jgi:hypothetical protein
MGCRIGSLIAALPSQRDKERSGCVKRRKERRCRFTTNAGARNDARLDDERASQMTFSTRPLGTSGRCAARCAHHARFARAERQA